MRPTAARPTNRGAANAGFTLLELVVTMGLLAVLFGLGVGFLGKTDGRAVAEAAIAGETRSAQLTARAEGLPTEVLVLPGEDGRPATVAARVLQPVVTFRFEPDERALGPELEGSYEGTDVPSGRFGHARKTDGTKKPILYWKAPPRVLDTRDGTALRFDVKLAARAQCTLLRLGRGLELSLDAESRPRARLQFRGQGGLDVQTAALQSTLALPLDRWCTLEIAADGRSVWLSLDGRELARGVAAGPIVHEPECALEVAPGDGAAAVTVDELRVFVWTRNPPQFLPSDVEPDRAYRLPFDADGQPVGSHTVVLLVAGEGGGA